MMLAFFDDTIKLAGPLVWLRDLVFSGFGMSLLVSRGIYPTENKCLFLLFSPVLEYFFCYSEANSRDTRG